MTHLILLFETRAMQTCGTDITFSYKENTHIFRVEIIVVGIES